MAFNEEQIIARGKQLGKSDEEIQSAIQKYKQQPQQPAQEDGASIIGRAVSNIPRSAVNVGRDIIGAVSKPKETITGLGKAALGGTMRLGEALTGIEAKPATKLESESLQTADSIGQFYKDRYGSVDKAKETFAEDPVGFLMDASAVLTGAGGAVKAAGTAGKLGGLAKTGSVISKAGKVLDPLTAAGKLTKPVAKQISNLTSKAADAIGGAGLKVSKSASKKLASDAFGNIDPKKFITEQGMTGGVESIKSQLYDLSKQSKNAVDDALASIPDRFVDKSAQGILDALDKKLSTVKSDELLSIKKDINTVKKAADTTGLNLSNMNQLKRTLDEYLNPFRKSGDLGETIAAKDMGNLRNKLKNFIEDKATEKGITNIKKMNQETAASRIIADGLSDTSSSGILGLRNAPSIAAGFIAGGPLGAAGAAIGKRILESPKFTTNVSKALKKLSGTELKSIEALAGGAKKTKANATALQKLTRSVKEEAQKSRTRKAALQAGRIENERSL